MKTDRRKPKARVRTGNVERRCVSALPGDWTQPDALAARLRPPGQVANLSAALMAAARIVLDLEAAGVITVDDEWHPRLRINWDRIRPSSEGGRQKAEG